VASFVQYRFLPRLGDPFALRVTRTSLPENTRGDFVLYRPTAARRLSANLALDFAALRAEELGLPLKVAEAPDEPFLNDRLRAFLVEGVRVNAAAGYDYVFVDDPSELEQRARVIVADEFPTRRGRAHFLIDGNGLLPMRVFGKEQYSAKFLRDRAHRLLPDWWALPPSLSPPGGESVPKAGEGPSPGGRPAAAVRLNDFIEHGLPGYAELRNKDPRHTSGLSPYLHFGHIGIHEVAERVLASGAPDEDVDAFLEEAVIRRELSFNLCFYNPHYDSLRCLPEWAKRTLDAHRRDRRKPCYSAAELEQAETHDDVWNLAQRQLVESGTMHGYLRMLWGKKVIEWSATPEEAHAFLIDQHARYALDGRDPNTHAGVLWCFGKHDRPWAPERPIFGTIRYMSSEQTRRKVKFDAIASGATSRNRALFGTADSATPRPSRPAPSRRR
jgi:deoxyribodipyrimidine photo-lyase